MDSKRTIVTLLDNELILKYFGENDSRSQDRRTNWAMSARILRAMQEPIKKGERCLIIYIDSTIGEYVNDGMADGEKNIHPQYLRLPDRFQKQERPTCCCGESNTIHRIDGPCYQIDKPTPEPEKCIYDHGEFLVPHTCKPKDAGLANAWKPKDELDEKIRKIWVDCTQDEGVKRIRELVEMARKCDGR